jgi:hypothetical protein
MAESMTNE